MPWFRLDDSFHSHPKVIAAGNEAIGLYVRCGTYAAEHLTDGFIPEDIAVLYGACDTGSRPNPGTGKPETLADTLVRTKLWRRSRSGWRMRDYLDYNPSREAVENERKAATERQRRRREGMASRRDDGVTHAVSPPAPSRPVPGSSVVDVVNRPNGSSGSRAGPGTIESIITEIRDVTGKDIGEAWAAKVEAKILQGRQVANPAAYCRQAIRADPQRFLPAAVPPPSAPAEQRNRARAHGAGPPPPGLLDGLHQQLAANAPPAPEPAS
jgi:hypothetical protein